MKIDLLPSEIARIKREQQIRRMTLIVSVIVLVVIGSWFAYRYTHPNVDLQLETVIQGEHTPESALHILIEHIGQKHGWKLEDTRKAVERYHWTLFTDAAEKRYFLVIDNLSSRQYFGTNLETRTQNIQAYDLLASYAWEPETGNLYYVPEPYLRKIEPQIEILEVKPSKIF